MDDIQGGRPPPDGWRSASQMKHVGRHGIPVLARALSALRDELIAEARAAGRSAEEAGAHVESEQIGYRKPRAGGVPALYAAPEIWAAVFDRLPPPAPGDWRSYTQLHRDGYRSGPVRISRKLKAARDDLVGDMIAAGFDEPDARSLIDAHLIGPRHAPGSRGTATLYASPDAVAMLERESILCRGPTGGLRDGPPDQTTRPPASDAVAMAYLEATRRLVERGDTGIANRFYRLISVAFPNTKEAGCALLALNEPRSNPGPCR